MTQHSSDYVPDMPSGKPDAVARRVRLREFQEQLEERVQAAGSEGQARVKQLGVMIGQMRCLLDLQEASEIIPVGSITRVPMTQSWFLGLTNIRGNLISVIDFAHFQGMAPTALDKECRIVAFAPSLSFNCGLLVSRVLGLRNIAEMQLQPSAEQDTAPWLSQRYLDSESQVWTALNLSLVIQDPQFLHVGS